MAINWKDHLPCYKGDIFKFARLLGSQEDIEKTIREYEENLSEEYKIIESGGRASRVLHKMKANFKKSLEGHIKEIETFKKREDINYKYKSSKYEIAGIIKEFICSNGEYSIYEVNLYGGGLYLIKLETDSLHLWEDSDYDEDGCNYFESFLSFSCTCNGGDHYDEKRSDIVICDSDIVYDNNTLVLMTKEYDLVLEVIERKSPPEPKNGTETAIIFDEPF